MKLYSPATVKKLIEKYNFHFQKNWGQNFLIDGNIVHKIVETAGLNSEDIILEIGPGIGTLTRAVADKAAKVIVIEIDRNLKPILQETLSDHNNIDIFWGNALKIDFDRLISEKAGGQFGSGGKSYKLIANLPYYITTPLIMHVLESRFHVSAMVIMVQKEVAQRMTALPGTKDYGVLTLAVYYYSQPEILLRVPRTVFMPQPEVDSAVVRLTPREQPPGGIDSEEMFFRVIRSAFGQRRKTLANTLAGVAEGLDKSRMAQVLAGLGINPGRRGETLSFEEFAEVSNAVYRLAAK